jgi:hypothetical protein
MPAKLESSHSNSRRIRESCVAWVAGLAANAYAPRDKRKWQKRQMPRPWSEYSAREWSRIRPLVERYKHSRYQLLMEYLIRKESISDDKLDKSRSRIGGRRLLVTIAFNDSEAIRWQVLLIRRHVPDSVHLIADNSTFAKCADEISSIADSHNLPYLRPPQSPWAGGYRGGRSHGLAMTWLWRNVIKPCRPAAFGFLDHDIFPLRATDPFAMLDAYPVGGRIQTIFDRWYLWAGFCFFRYADVCRFHLNFSTDWAAGLDTGGYNWFRIYRYLDRRKVPNPDLAFESNGPDAATFELLGDWLHETNFTTIPLDLPDDRRKIIRANTRRQLIQRLRFIDMQLDSGSFLPG